MKLLLVSMIQGAMIVIFQCFFCLYTYRVANLTFFSLTFHKVY